MTVPGRKPSLRAVELGEVVEQQSPKTIEEAARLGDEIAGLRLTRLAISRKLDDPNCPARDMAALSKRHMELGREIAGELLKLSEEAEDAESVGDEAWDEEAI